jgi:formylglycine-generating enzyme required for sulfatase activity
LAYAATQTAQAQPTATATRRPLPTLPPETPDHTATAAFATAEALRTRPTWTPTPLPTATFTPNATATAAFAVAQAVATAEALGLDPAGVRVGTVDGALYLRVPAGAFTMGSATGGSDDERPVHTVDLDEFWIMRTEVTNAQYARCVAAGACAAPSNSRWQDNAYANHPVTHVDWNQAQAYATWSGGRLPTEAEWEKACRGDDQRTYPWGSAAPDASLANFNGNVGDTEPVGSYSGGASPYGLADMAGNVWEWTADWYDGGYYASSPAVNPTGPASGGTRVLRGGSFHYVSRYVRCAYRVRYAPDYRFDRLGFRVVAPGF